MIMFMQFLLHLLDNPTTNVVLPVNFKPQADLMHKSSITDILQIQYSLGRDECKFLLGLSHWVLQQVNVLVKNAYKVEHFSTIGVLSRIEHSLITQWYPGSNLALEHAFMVHVCLCQHTFATQDSQLLCRLIYLLEPKQSLFQSVSQITTGFSLGRPENKYLF